MQGRTYHLDRTLSRVHPTAFVAQTATLVGDVTIGRNSSVWFSAVIRADLASVAIGDNCSVQDGAVIHVDVDNPTMIGNQVTVGHGAVVHGCKIGDNVLIGIRSVVLSGAQIGANSIIGACALVTEGMHVPANSLVLGAPARVVRAVTPEQESLLSYMWEEYVALSRAYKHQRHDLDRLC